MTENKVSPREQLTELGRTAASGALAGGLLSRIPIDASLLGLLGLLFICLPFDFLTGSSIRLGVRVSGITLCLLALHTFNHYVHLTVGCVVLWFILVTFAVNRDAKRR